MGESYFRRGLSQPFLDALRDGPLHPVVEGARIHGLDLGVRENYFNLYSGRNSVLKLRHLPRRGEFEIHIHGAFRPPASLAATVSGKYRTHRFAVGVAAAWARQFRSGLPALLAAAKQFDKPEGATEFALAVAHREAPLTIIDRQVQLGGVPDSRVDAFAVLDEGGASVPSLVMLELKSGQRLDVAEVVKQVDRYRKHYVVNGKLRPDVAECLQRVWLQKATLGFVAARSPVPTLCDLRVEFLVALSSNKEARALGAGNRPAPGGLVRYVGTTAERPKIPPSSAWEVLRGT